MRASVSLRSRKFDSAFSLWFLGSRLRPHPGTILYSARLADHPRCRNSTTSASFLHCYKANARNEHSGRLDRPA